MPGVHGQYIDLAHAHLFSLSEMAQTDNPLFVYQSPSQSPKCESLDCSGIQSDGCLYERLYLPAGCKRPAFLQNAELSESGDGRKGSGR